MGPIPPVVLLALGEEVKSPSMAMTSWLWKHLELLESVGWC